jgi:ABC-type oligopeptide transport system substrate-binding subunit
VALAAWGADYQDPPNFLNQLLTGGTIGSADNLNFSYFDDASYDRRLEAAARLSGPGRYLAYAKLDADIARKAAPVAALSTLQPRASSRPASAARSTNRSTASTSPPSASARAASPATLVK